MEQEKRFSPERDKNNSALFAAIESDDFTAFLMMLRNKEDVNKANNEGVTPLMATIKHDRYMMFLQLLRVGADPNAIDNSGQSVMAYSIRYNDSSVNMYHLLLERQIKK